MNTEERLAALEGMVIQLYARVKALEQGRDQLKVATGPNRIAPDVASHPPSDVDSPDIDLGLGEKYVSVDALINHLKALAYPHRVTVDGVSVHEGSSPEQRYFTTPIGFVSRVPPAPVAPAPINPNIVQVAAGDASSFVDVSAWTAENWAWFAVQGYAIQSRVDQQKHIDKVQGYGPGGKYYDPSRPQIRPGNI